MKKAIEKEPFTFACKDRIAMEMETTPFHKTIRRFRQTTGGRGDSFVVQRIVEKECEGILPLPVVKSELNQVEVEDTSEGEPLLKCMRMTSDNQAFDRLN